MRIHNPKTGHDYFQKVRRSLPTDREPHELTFSCYRGFKFLEKDRTRRWFVQAMENARSKHHIGIWAWVIMPEHVHMILVPNNEETSVSKVRGRIKEDVARLAITWLEEHAPAWIPKITVREGKLIRRRFWQPGGGYDRTIEQTRTLNSMIDYIHLNPVRRGLVERAVDWEWSSARWYAGLPAVIEMDPLPMLEE